jgi:cytochrome P450 family 6
MISLFEWLTISLTISSAVFIGLYLYFIRNFSFWKRLGVPYAKPLPFLGNLKECVSLKLTIGEHLKNLYDEYGDKPYVGIFCFDQPSLLVRDPELVKNILVKDANIFQDRIVTINANLDPMFAKALFVLKGQRWRQLRANLTPVFTSGKMKNMFYLVDLCCKDLTDFLDTEVVGGK